MREELKWSHFSSGCERQQAECIGEVGRNAMRVEVLAIGLSEATGGSCSRVHRRRGGGEELSAELTAGPAVDRSSL